MRIFFDLDGTLIDSRERLYSLFQHLVVESNLSSEEYWELKREQKNHPFILGQLYNYSPEKIKEFEYEWMKLIENDKWLKKDSPFNGVEDYLRKLKSRHIKLFIITARQFKAKAIGQITGFGWDNIFEQIIVTEQKAEKATLIKPYIKTNEEHWLIGDTGKDIQAGKKLNFKTAGVLTGCLNKKSLLKYNPDQIVESLTDLILK